MQNLMYNAGQLYVPGQMAGSNLVASRYANPNFLKGYENLGLLKNVSGNLGYMFGNQPQSANTAPVTNQNVKQQMGRLTGQASDALYGGILGYQPKPMTAMGGQQYEPPQGNLVDPFLNMQGLLGRSQFQTPRMY